MAFTADKVRQGVQKDTGYSIDNSLRFENGDSPYLNRTPSSAGNRKTWTLSCWVKRSKLGTNSGSLSGNYNIIKTSNAWFGFSTENLHFGWGPGNSDANWAVFHTNALFRDPSAWYHIVLSVDMVQATASNRVKLYVNGSQVTDFSSTSYPSQNSEADINNTVEHRIGNQGVSTLEYFDGYMAEVHFIDGQALDHTSFGETGTYGEWKPIAYAGSYGTNGFYLDFGNTGTKHTLTANGNAQHSTAQSKIGSSSILFDGSGDNISLPQSSDFAFGDNDFTIEYWIRLDSVSSEMQHIGQTAGGTNTWRINSTSSRMQVYFGYSGSELSYFNNSGSNQINTADTWYHVAVVKSDSTIYMYINGATAGSGAWTGSMGEIAGPVRVGHYRDGTGGADGYMDEIRISNVARYTTTFTPSTTAFTDDANTLLLIHSDTTNGSTTFTDDSGVVGGLGNDASSNTNNWTVNNLAATDQMLDSPTNNFCTLNPIGKLQSSYTSGAISEGNLKVHLGSPDAENFCTMAVSTGKWYFESYTAVSSGSPSAALVDLETHKGGSGTRSFISMGSGSTTIYDAGSENFGGTSPGTISSTDVLGLALDLDNGAVYVSVNGTWANSGDPTSGSSKTGALVTSTHHTKLASGTGTWSAFYTDGSAADSGNIFNFGQDSSFAGSVTVGTETDDNSNGSFKYNPPSGFLALCTSNLPDPAVIPSKHFNTILWSGDNNATRSLTGVGFQPDLIWLKVRSNATVYHIQDAVRTFGIDKTIGSDTTSAEPLSDSTNYGSVGSVGSDGFTVAAGSASGYTLHQINLSGRTYVAWNWKAGNATLGTGDFTQGSIASTCSRNVDAGFSIVSYTGNGSGGSTVGHGLSSAPEMVIIKNRDDGTRSWQVYHSALGGTNYIFLDTTGATGTSVGPWSNTDTTNTLITLGTWPELNQSGSAHIAYCFHSVAQYSKVFSYTGNGSTDGTFVYCDFRPKYVMLKASSISGEHWWLFDTERDTYNVMNSRLAASESAEEKYTVDFIDVTSNGFKLRTSSVMANSSGATYIGIAFAELPAKYNNAR